MTTWVGGRAAFVGRYCGTGGRNRRQLRRATQPIVFEIPLQPSATVLLGGRAGFVVKMLADEPPVLKLGQLGPNAVLSWSAAAPELILQTSTNLALPGAWVDLNPTPVVSNAFLTVIVAPTNPAQFFRLKP